MSHTVRLLLVAAVACSSAVAAQSTQAPTAAPAPLPRAGHVMVAPRSGGVLLFGGHIVDGTAHSADPLWQWDGRTWRALGAGPQNRTLPAGAYDTDRDTLVVYGGIDVATNHRFDETWEWKAGVWRKMPGPSPGSRDHHAMVYDAARKRVVMFGGAAGETFYDDTWTWDGAAWTKLDAPGPPSLVHHAMTYDAARRRVVLFGGFDKSRTAGGLWEFDGTRWQAAAPAGPAPEPRSRHRLAFDAARGEVVLFGGTESTETWTWNGTRWARHDVPGPSPRSVMAMAYDSARQRVVLFGGSSRDGKGIPPFNYLADTWEWDGARWTEITPSAAPWPAARGSHGMAYDEKRGMTLVYGDRGAEASSLWGWDGTRWHAFNAPGPGLRRHIKLAYDASRDRTVLFSGLDDTETQPGDTWEWDGARWHRVATEGPEPRGSYSLAYDPRRRRVVLFGGLSQTSGTMGDTWEWDGRAWTKMSDTGPGPRGEAGAVYDSRTQSIIMAGGTTWTPQTSANGRRGWTSAPKSQMPRDTWSWDGRAWRKLGDDAVARFGAIVPDPITGQPLRVAGQSDTSLHGDLLAWNGRAWSALLAPPIPARFFHEAALDKRRKRLVVFGGSLGQAAVADLWEWDGAAWKEIR